MPPTATFVLVEKVSAKLRRWNHVVPLKHYSVNCTRTVYLKEDQMHTAYVSLRLCRANAALKRCHARKETIGQMQKTVQM